MIRLNITWIKKYKIVMGKKAAKNIGVCRDMTTIVKATLQVVWKISARFQSKLMSTTLISLVNLLIILPIGVVSKNDIGDRIIFCSMFSCRISEAFTVPYPKPMVPMNTKNAEIKNNVYQNTYETNAVDKIISKQFNLSL